MLPLKRGYFAIIALADANDSFDNHKTTQDCMTKKGTDLFLKISGAKLT